jgi:hypothetical protein
MATKLPKNVAAYMRATNNHDVAAFIACFTKSAVVNDAGREFGGLAAIKAWSDRDIIEARVTLEVLDVADRDGEIVVTTKVDGNYDKTGLPDPFVDNHYIMVEGDQVA